MPDTALPSLLSIQRLTPIDLPLMAQLLKLFGEAFEDIPTYNAALPDAAYQARLLANETFVALVALEAGNVVGALAAYELVKFEQASSEFYIYDLAVTASHRRRGIATALIEQLKVIAAAGQGWVIFVQADYVDPPAIALYSKLGTREDVLHFDIAVPGEGRS